MRFNQLTLATFAAAAAAMNIAPYASAADPQSDGSSQKQGQMQNQAQGQSGQSQQAGQQQAGQRQAGQSQGGQSQQSGAQASGQSQQSQAPEGFVLVEERVILLTANEPQIHFLQAQQALQQNNPKVAAAETRIAANYLEMQASRAGGQAKQSLTSAADDLRNAAGKLEGNQNGQGNSQQLTNNFAQAALALSSHHHSKAAGFLQNDKHVMAGHDLEAAAQALAAAYTFASKQAPQNVVSTVTDAQLVASNLIAPSGATGAQAGESQPGEAQTASGQQAPTTQPGAAGMPNASRVVQDLASAIETASQNLPPQNSNGSSNQGNSN
ncbi:MAG TPA: hypothetical protein VGN72_14895 [Tepidisphaeraceae bacterium]|jgi:hypothetical protein|nr:hypothetical protein [Tepidisphaeraceae bacterium]